MGCLVSCRWREMARKGVGEGVAVCCGYVLITWARWVKGSWNGWPMRYQTVRMIQYHIREEVTKSIVTQSSTIVLVYQEIIRRT